MFSLLAFCSVHVATINIEEGGGAFWCLGQKAYLKKKTLLKKKKGNILEAYPHLQKELIFCARASPSHYSAAKYVSKGAKRKRSSLFFVCGFCCSRMSKLSALEELPPSWHNKSRNFNGPSLPPPRNKYLAEGTTIVLPHSSPYMCASKLSRAGSAREKNNLSSSSSRIQCQCHTDRQQKERTCKVGNDSPLSRRPLLSRPWTFVP